MKSSPGEILIRGQKTVRARPGQDPCRLAFDPKFGSRPQLFAPEAGPKPRNWGKSRSKMDPAPSRWGTLSVGRRLGWLAVAWGGWPSLGSFGRRKELGLGVHPPPNHTLHPTPNPHGLWVMGLHTPRFINPEESTSRLESVWGQSGVGQNYPPPPSTYCEGAESLSGLGLGWLLGEDLKMSPKLGEILGENPGNGPKNPDRSPFPAESLLPAHV